MNMPPPIPPSTVPPKKSGGCLKGCLITLAILLVLSGIAAYFVVKNIGAMTRQLSSAAIDTATEEILKEAKLDPAQSARIKQTVNGFTAKIRNGEVSMEQGIKVMENLAKGPFIGFVMASSFHAAYLKNSALPPAEVEAGKVIIGRFTQGIIHRSIPESESEQVFNLFTVKKDAEGKNRALKEQLTDAEVRDVLAKMKASADKANIPPVPAEVDIATELQKAIDTGLRGGV